MIPIPPTPPEGTPGAPFNAAIATLMRIDRILTDIKNVSLAIGINFSRGEGQFKRCMLAKDLYVQSCALISDVEDKKKIKELLNNVKTVFVPFYPGSEDVVPVYSSEVEEYIDETLILIQEFLQKGGYFMPSAVDKKGL